MKSYVLDEYLLHIAMRQLGYGDTNSSLLLASSALKQPDRSSIIRFDSQHKTIICVIECKDLHDAHGILVIGTLADEKRHILGNSRHRFFSLRRSPRGIASKLRRFSGLPFRSHVLRSAPSLQSIRPNQPTATPLLQIHHSQLTLQTIRSHLSCSYAPILPIFIP